MGTKKTTKKVAKKPVAKKKMNNNVTEMAREHIGIARQISSRLKRRYTWVAMEDLYSYALLGLTQSANAYDPSRGVPFPNYASQKGMFWAIDEMRKDGILRRRSSANMPRVLPFSEAVLSANTDEGWTPDIQDVKADHAKNLMEVRDLSRTLLKRLEDKDRTLLMMYYSEHMTFREIAGVMKISESSVCLRHKALIKRLRRSATSMKVA
ncbi:MAG: sigma-70 family RNA polymerase sigma factor [Phycisphaerae bacterium]|nr:sigma-70 family RNA polymerase sigma factor [Phycisphaerae bacterium]